jgi:hypothetical protein
MPTSIKFVQNRFTKKLEVDRTLEIFPYYVGLVMNGVMRGQKTGITRVSHQNFVAPSYRI